MLLIIVQIANKMQVRDPTQICYTRSTMDTPPDPITPVHTTIRRVPTPQHCQTPNPGSGCNQSKTPTAAANSTQLLSATDYADYMKDTYPLLVRS